MKLGFVSLLRAVVVAVLVAIGWLGTCPSVAATPPPTCVD